METDKSQGEESQDLGSNHRSSIYHYVTLGMSLKVSDPQSPSLSNGGNSGYLAKLLRKSDEKMNVNALCRL